MAYLALYRAFRPTTLDDVVRQEHIVTVLKNQIATGKIGHAYLFCGPRGTGKTSIAKIFASAINCEKPVNGSPCGKCPTCKALAEQSNLDISEIDAASNNGVDEMRDLREKVQYPPVAGKYKVYVIDEVHMLSQGAFNALLKTLEEPPAHAVFILATTESAKIPATILSRCMRFDFKLIPQADLEARLRYVLDTIGKPYDKEAISAIARAGAGSVRDMLSIADTCVSYATGKLTYEAVTSVLGSADFDGVATLCKAMLLGDTGTAFESAENFLAEGKGVGTLVKDLMYFFHACTVAKTCKNANAILALPEASYKKVMETSSAVDSRAILRASEIFAQIEQTLKYSASPRVLFETAVMKASMPFADYDIDGLIARISALEEKLKNGNFTVKEAGRVEPKVEPVNELPKQTPIVKAEKEYQEPELEVPPDEAETGGNIYFDEDNAPKPKVEQPKPITPPRAVGESVKKDAKTLFGQFLRALRKVGKNGVLFTICMDLENAFEEDIFVLQTPSDTIYRSLCKDEHRKIIKDAFDTLGVAEDGFDIRLKGKKTDEFQKAVNEVKDTFQGVKIEIK